MDALLFPTQRILNYELQNYLHVATTMQALSYPLELFPNTSSYSIIPSRTASRFRNLPHLPRSWLCKPRHASNFTAPSKHSTEEIPEWRDCWDQMACAWYDWWWRVTCRLSQPACRVAGRQIRWIHLCTLCMGHLSEGHRLPSKYTAKAIRCSTSGRRSGGTDFLYTRVQSLHQKLRSGT